MTSARRSRPRSAPLRAMFEAGAPEPELQMIHGDVTDYNLLATAADDGAVRLSGLIDFGDTTRSWRIAELANACVAIACRDAARAAARAARGAGRIHRAGGAHRRRVGLDLAADPRSRGRLRGALESPDATDVRKRLHGRSVRGRLAGDRGADGVGAGARAGGDPGRVRPAGSRPRPAAGAAARARTVAGARRSASTRA